MTENRGEINKAYDGYLGEPVSGVGIAHVGSLERQPKTLNGKQQLLMSIVPRVLLPAVIGQNNNCEKGVIPANSAGPL